MKIPFQRLAADSDPGVRQAVERVLASGRFVLGPEVEAFERAFAVSIGVAHAVGVASGTDAITLALAAAGIGSGDRVLTAAFSTGYTAIGIQHAGATPVFADVEPESLCLDGGAVARTLEEHEVQAIVPVHIFGGAGASWGKLLEVADRHRRSRHRGRLPGARSSALRGGRSVPSGGPRRSASIPPRTSGPSAMPVSWPRRTKGSRRTCGASAPARRESATTTSRRAGTAVSTRSRLRCSASGFPRCRKGTGGAPPLRFATGELLDGLPLRFVTPGPGVEGSSHLFVIRTARRDGLREHLERTGIDALVHYPAALTEQPAFSAASGAGGACPEAEAAAREVLSLPLHPGLSEREVDRVAATVRAFFEGQRPDGAVSE